MAGELREVPLGDLVRNYDSQRVPLSGRVRETRPGPYPYYGATGVMDHVDDYLFEGLHLLVAEDGSVETGAGTPYVQLVDGRFWVNNHAHVLRGANDKDTKYFYYALLTVPVRPFMSGSVQAKLSQANLNQILIPYPAEEATRSAIAYILGTLDDKIELNRRMNETLEEMAQALFKDWFVDFGPVRAKMDGREPYLPPDLWALFPDRLVDSELGEIPDGWEVKALSQIATFRNGLALQKYPPTNRPTLPVIKIAQLRAGHVNGADLADLDLPPDYVVHDGDVLFSWSGSLELDVWAGGDGALNQHLFKVMSPDYPKWLCYQWVLHHLPGFRNIAADKATTMGHIKRHHLSEALTVIPDATVLTAVNRHMESLLKDSLALRVESHSLAAQRDALLPRLVSGQLRVVAK